MSRTGGPARATRGAALAYFREHVGDVTDQCMIWPFTLDRQGYGRLHLNGVDTRAHIQACRYWRGDPPDPRMEAAHGRLRRCDSVACWNGDHLSWKTRQGNLGDIDRDGTRPVGDRHWNAKLNDTTALDILRQDAAGVSMLALAGKYGVGPATVRDLVTRKSWTHVTWVDLPGQHRRRTDAKLTERDAVAILDRYHAGIPRRAIAEQFGVSTSTVYQIAARKTWRHVQWPAQVTAKNSAAG